jgi:hypothetical protein
MASAYKVDYNDKQLTKIESQMSNAVKESDKTYDKMINQSDKYFNSQVDAVKQYGETQKKNQQAQTDFAIDKIEQEKDQAHKDYLKEQTASYVDWQKQSNQYGSNAEQMASSGLAHTGYSESSQVAIYNAYQNRVATARETYNRAVLNYNNAITEARLQNNSLLAEIAYNTLKTSLELSLQGFQYKNDLVLQKANTKRDIENTYYSRYQDRISQINTENALAEQIRQYNTSLAEEKRQYNASLAENKRQYNTSLALQKEQFEWQKKNSNVSSSGGGGGGDGGGGGNPKPKGDEDNTTTNPKTSSKLTKAQALNKLNKGQVKTVSAAMALLNSLNLDPKVPMLDSITWNKAKKMGMLSSEFENVNSYAQYLERYCRYAINECM